MADDHPFFSRSLLLLAPRFLADLSLQFDEFTTPVHAEKACSSKPEDARVGSLALTRSSTVIGSTAQQVFSLDRLGTLLWRHDPYGNGEKGKTCSYFSDPIVGLNQTTFVTTSTVSFGETVPFRVHALHRDGTPRWIFDQPTGKNDSANGQCSPPTLGSDGKVLWFGCGVADGKVTLTALDTDEGIEFASHDFTEAKGAKTDYVAEVMVSERNPKLLFFTTRYSFFGCTIDGHMKLDDCWHIDLPTSEPYRLAEPEAKDAEDLIFLYDYKDEENVMAIVSIKDKKLKGKPVSIGTKAKPSPGSALVREDRVFVITDETVQALDDADLKSTWSSNSTLVGIKSGLALSDSELFAYTGNGLYVIENVDKTKPNAEAVKVPSTAVGDPIKLNTFTEPVLAGTKNPTLIISSNNAVASFHRNIKTTHTEAAINHDPAMSGGTIAAIAVFSSLIGSALFAGIYFYNTQRPGQDRLPLI